MRGEGKTRRDGKVAFADSPAYILHLRAPISPQLCVPVSPPVGIPLPAFNFYSILRQIWDCLATYTLDNDTTGQYVRPKSTFLEFEKQEIEQSIPSRFGQQVAKYPHRLALKTKTHQLSYTELNELSNSVAGSILSAQGERAEPVVLLLEQGALLIASILGVLKAGKTYIVMDSTHPKTRLQYALEDVQAELIITDNANFVL